MIFNIDLSLLWRVVDIANPRAMSCICITYTEPAEPAPLLAQQIGINEASSRRGRWFQRVTSFTMKLLDVHYRLVC
jgi:hypothetical protein